MRTLLTALFLVVHLGGAFAVHAHCGEEGANAKKNDLETPPPATPAQRGEKKG